MHVANFHTGSGDPTSREGDERAKDREKDEGRERQREKMVDFKRTTSKAEEN